MEQRKVAVIGAGPGGLAAAALLAAKGSKVDVFEAKDKLGGRNAFVEMDGFRFDLGPTFFLMPEVLETIFSSCGRRMSDYLDLERVDPLYELNFADGTTLSPSSDPELTAREIAKINPYDAKSFWDYRSHQAKKFNVLYPSLKKSFPNAVSLVNHDSLKAIPFLDLRSIYNELEDYFQDERVRLAFTFQAKYLGMSPFKCPSLFTILSHIEHELGVWHPKGGVHQVSQALGKLCSDVGVEMHLSTDVEAVLVERGVVQGVRVNGVDHRNCDAVFMNADFAYAMSNLFPDESRKRYTDLKLSKMKYSCSTFMIYAGVEGELDWPHHRIFFPQNYRRNVEDLSENLVLPEDPAFYVHNPSRLDKSLAPKGKSAVYILVPVPNVDAGINWNEIKEDYRNRIYGEIQKRTGLDLRDRLITEKVITPDDWEKEHSIYKGATFSLAHSLDQMMHLRPQNKSEEFRNLFLVGGGTHPGSGLPTILQSAIISSGLFEKSVAAEGILDQFKQRQLNVMTRLQELRT